MWTHEYISLGWWLVTDGTREFQTQDETAAKWLCSRLNEE